MSQKTLSSALTPKSQITLPKRVRDFLGLAPGDQVRFEIEGHTVRIIPVVSKLEENFGKVTPCNRPEDFRRTREAFEEGVGKDAEEEC